MAKTSQEIERGFIDGLKSNTGKDLKDWLTAIKGSGIEKRNDIIKWLKEQNDFGHMNASLLAGIYFNNGNPVYASEEVLLDNQFEKYQEMRPLFERLKKDILDWDDSVRVLVKKTYVSVTKKREFAAINVRKGELRLGMDLGDLPFEGVVEKAKLTGPMPRISHMVVIKNHYDIDKKLFQLLDEANKRVNP